MRGTVTKIVVPLAIAAMATNAFGQDPNEKWQTWFSDTLGVSFLAFGQPAEEVVEFGGPLGTKLEKTIGVGFNADQAEFSIFRLRLKPSENLTVRQLLDLRLAVPREKAPDFKLREETEKLDSDYPCIHAWVEYTGPDEAPVSRRILAISSSKGLWLVEASGLTTSAARESAHKLFDSIRMDSLGKIQPGMKRQ